MSIHLILLVGTNPLPNYVTAKYLISKGGISKIWFVFSEENKSIKQKGTGNFAENLKDVILENHPNFGIDNFGFCSLEDVEDANKIKAKVKDLLLIGEDANRIKANVKDSLLIGEGKIPQEAKIHLNYTGGTKVMSVHVRSVFKECERLDSRTTFSYLSSRTFKLKYDYSGNETPDLRKEINITLGDLTKLHGYEKVNQHSGSALDDWAGALDELSKIIKNGELIKFLEWKNDIVKSFRIQKRDDSVFPSSEFEDLLNSIPKEYSFLDDERKFLRKTIGSKEPPSIQFLNGIWLEQYVYKVLDKKIDTDKVALEWDWELKKKKPEKSEGNVDRKKFQLDLLLMNSYQVCGISCTVIKEEGTCKQKGFEVVHRANQIGGEEAKAVLVTCLSNKREEDLQAKKLEQDLRDDTDTGEKLIVLGIKDLEEDKLWDKIKKHMELE